MTRNSGRRSGWRSLTVQLVSLIVLPLTVIVLAITVGSTTLHQNAMRDLVGERDERVVQMAARAVENQITAREIAVRGLALQISDALESGASQEDELPSILDRSAYLDALFDTGIVVIDMQGNVVTARGSIANKLQNEEKIFSDGIRAFQADKNLSLFVTSAFPLADTVRTTSFVFAPTQNRAYLIGGAFYVDALAEQALQGAFSPGQEASVLMLDPGREVLYQQGFSLPQVDVLNHPGVQEALLGKTGRVYTGGEREEHVVAYTSVERMKWGLLIEEPWEQVASPVLETTHLAPLAMIPVLLLSMFALLFAYRQVIRPLQALSKQAGSLGWGDYSAIERSVGGIDEIRYLQLELIHMAQKVRAAQRNLHSFIGAITSGQEEERRRLARELHDETIQSLISFKQHIQLVEMDYADQPVAQALVKLEDVAEKTIENVRRMVRALRPIYLEDLGLVAALNMLVTEMGQSSGISIDFERQGKERRLDNAVELALYRIVQEALNNIARHAEASHATVTLSFVPKGIKILIEDDGKGFHVPNSPAEFAPGGHFGLLGMYERAELIGGTMQVQSVPGEGTRLMVEVTTPA